ncbi:FAD/NAD(P)-binding protein [Streptomyces sp. NPDC001137]|uniref:FAD/NAD(P)-binding protein n=1 Tax=Streptomyces sp. NPDC001137 TaxID=3154378 RepID=UPI0033232BAF
MSERQLEVCVIGAGPRGLSVLERLCANARAHALGTEVVVHVVDPCPPGAGRVWRTDQSHHLLMNTVASQVTLFTDPSVRMAGELAPGPSLYEWARSLVLMGDPWADDGVLDDQVLAEARDLTPDSYPTRAFYGHYLRWVFARVLRTAPSHVGVVVHPLRAVRLHDRPDGLQCVTLANGTRIDGLDAVVSAFVVDSAEVPGSRIEATCLVEARLPEPDLRHTTDPLLRHLADTGQCRPFVVPDAEHGDHETGGLSVTRRPYHLVAADGRPHPRRFAYGVPTEAVHWVTAAGVRPGVDSVTLGDSDAIALALLALRPVPAPPATAAVPLTPVPQLGREPGLQAFQETE